MTPLGRAPTNGQRQKQPDPGRHPQDRDHPPPGESDRAGPRQVVTPPATRPPAPEMAPSPGHGQQSPPRSTGSPGTGAQQQTRFRPTPLAGAVPLSRSPAATEQAGRVPGSGRHPQPQRRLSEEKPPGGEPGAVRRLSPGRGAGAGAADKTPAPRRLSKDHPAHQGCTPCGPTDPDRHEAEGSGSGNRSPAYRLPHRPATHGA